MTTTFLSRVDRGIRDNIPSDGPGPGAYASFAPFSNSLPGFAPFASSTKRMVDDQDKGPPPGAYEVATTLLTKKPTGACNFKSKSERFKEIKVGDPSLPTTTYYPPSTLKHGKPKQFPKPYQNYEIIQMGIHNAANSVPSIPTKHQSYGYESTPNGKVQLQDPVNPGFSGVKNDSVGPCDYDPKINVKYKSVPKANFSKAPDREALDRISAKVRETPGPGYYNSPSPFDLLENGPGLGGRNDSDFLMRLSVARKHNSSVFESKTQREVFQEVRQREHDPGPGHYEIPPAIVPKQVPPSQQCFSTGEVRFKEPPRSLRNFTAPGAYNPLASDFDKLRMKILKQKKMASRSSWAQNVAFTSTESRFSEDDYVKDVPAPLDYHPKTSISDNLPKENIRGGAFGTKDKRFKEEKPMSQLTRDQQAAIELNKDIAPFLQRPTESSRSPSPNSRRPAFTSVFAPSSEDRFRPVKTPPNPPPGAYNTQPSWKKGAISMAPSAVVSKKVPDISPGPGQYSVPRSIGEGSLNKHKNRKNIMVSTAARLERYDNARPGPGDYDPTPVEGNLLRKSHNILLSNSYY